MYGVMYYYVVLNEHFMRIRRRALETTIITFFVTFFIAALLPASQLDWHETVRCSEPIAA